MIRMMLPKKNDSRKASGYLSAASKKVVYCELLIIA